MDHKNKDDIMRQLLGGNKDTWIDSQTNKMRQHNNIQSQNQCNIQYYDQFKRLYITSFYLSEQMKILFQKRKDLQSKVLRLQKKNDDFNDQSREQNQNRKKRVRRTAQQIQRKYICEVEICQKCYGSQGSLQQHIKLKHPELYQAKVPYGSYY